MRRFNHLQFQPNSVAQHSPPEKNKKEQEHTEVILPERNIYGAVVKGEFNKTDLKRKRSSDILREISVKPTFKVQHSNILFIM